MRSNERGMRSLRVQNSFALYLVSDGYCRSFHEAMEARVRVGGELLDEIEVRNGLRQGCTMAPTLFNLYACVVAERWLEKVKDVEGVGTCIYYKLDQQLFRRSTREAEQECFTECQFADDVALLATTRAGAEVHV